jgi:transposase
MNRLTDPQWLLVEPLLPTRNISPKGGRPILHRRPILDAILHKLATGCPWYDLPFDSPSFSTVYRCYHDWHRTGVLAAVLQTLRDDLQTRGGLDLAACFPPGPPGEAINQFARLIVDWRGTWQLNTALIYVGLATNAAARASRRQKSKSSHPRQITSLK